MFRFGIALLLLLCGLAHAALVKKRHELQEPGWRAGPRGHVPFHVRDHLAQRSQRHGRRVDVRALGHVRTRLLVIHDQAPFQEQLLEDAR
eukprot:7097270-Lingulodinium_polyedra.AAC.1